MRSVDIVAGVFVFLRLESRCNMYVTLGERDYNVITWPLGQCRGPGFVRVFVMRHIDVASGSTIHHR